MRSVGYKLIESPLEYSDYDIYHREDDENAAGRLWILREQSMVNDSFCEHLTDGQELIRISKHNNFEEEKN